ncbi:tyrosine-type recombinase/integrase [Microbacterium paludicola]|uniref:tyrosine-type recombinase/integrase n=1 Tax=Microbacterium paludicola TaxID=300019 RepID=UPI0031DEE16B
MGSAYSYKTTTGLRWEARYRRPDGKQTSKKGFKRKRDALDYITEVESSKNKGTYISESEGQVTVGSLGEDWIIAHSVTIKPSTAHSEESAWRVHVEPKWGSRKIGTIRHTEVTRWVAELSKTRSATTVKRAHGLLAAILDSAVRDRRIAFNPAREVKTPRKRKKAKPYLNHEQVERLADASKYPDFVRFLAYTGLRWGEATGLKVVHVDRKRRRLWVEENAVKVNGHVQVGSPKPHENRSVPYPAFLDAALARACKGKTADDLLWPAELGGYLSQGNAVSGWFASAVKRVRREEVEANAAAEERGEDASPVMPRVTPHDLRHTAASLAVSAGANVKAVQRMLGHASASMTLDVYTDLFEDDLNEVAEALDRTRAAALGKK